MNPLVLLPLLAAATMAAPGVLLNQGLTAQGLVLNQALPAQGLVLNQVQHAVGYAQVQVPVTKTVHYQSQPVVTGYSTTVVKPALAHAPLALSGIPSQIAFGRQIEIPQPPSDLPIQPPNNTAPAPPADLPQPPADFPTPPAGLPITPPPPSTTPEPTTTAAPPSAGGDSRFLQVINPIQYQYSNLAVAQPLAVQNAAVVAAPAVQVAAVRAAQAGDFEPLVTKEKVLAPVRTHTQITPQYTQIQPEITVRKIVHDVPVHTPVAVHTPVVQQLVQGHTTLIKEAKIIHA